MKRHVFQESGVTLLELTVAAGLMASVTAVVLQLLLGGRTAFVVQPESADVHQCLRVAVDLVSRDLRVAGTGLVRGNSPVPLWSVMPAVRPARRGLRASDDEMAAFDDRISIVYTLPGAIQAPLPRDMASRVDVVWIDTARAGCRPGSACGFRRGMRVLLFDIGGVGDGYEVFTLTGTRREAMLHGSPNSPLARVYRRADTWVTEVTQRVLRTDLRSGTQSLRWRPAARATHRPHRSGPRGVGSAASRRPGRCLIRGRRRARDADRRGLLGERRCRPAGLGRVVSSLGQRAGRTSMTPATFFATLIPMASENLEHVPSWPGGAYGSCVCLWGGSILLVLVMTVLSARPVAAQSLAEVARREAARRESLGRQSRIYTNEDLRAYPPTSPPDGEPSTEGGAIQADGGDESSDESVTSVNDGTQSAQSAQSAQSGASDDEDEPVRDESYLARPGWQRNELFRVALESRVNALTTEFVNVDDPAQRALVAIDRQNVRSEMQRVDDEIERLNADIADIEEEAHRAGVPPGWLR